MSQLCCLHRRPCGNEQPRLSKMCWTSPWQHLLRQCGFSESVVAFGSQHKKEFRFLTYMLVWASAWQLHSWRLWALLIGWRTKDQTLVVSKAWLSMIFWLRAPGKSLVLGTASGIVTSMCLRLQLPSLCWRNLLWNPRLPPCDLWPTLELPRVLWRREGVQLPLCNGNVRWPVLSKQPVLFMLDSTMPQQESIQLTILLAQLSFDSLLLTPSWTLLIYLAVPFCMLLGFLDVSLIGSVFLFLSSMSHLARLFTSSFISFSSFPCWIFWLIPLLALLLCWQCTGWF